MNNESHKRIEMEKLMYQERDNPCPTQGLTRMDIKQGLVNEVKYIEGEIERLQEQLRVSKEKLKLIEKNKDLEAYINLLNR